jgi:hypothetical protein
MGESGKAPSGRRIWTVVRDELLLNLYPLPFSTLAPTVYHVYLHPDDFAVIEGIVPRMVTQIERALNAEVAKVNNRLARAGRRALGRLLDREVLAPIEIPAAGWALHIAADRNSELARGQVGIVSTLCMPATLEYGGTPTTRIVRAVVAEGRRTATTTSGPEAGGGTTPDGASTADSGERARLTYRDDQGPHVFVMRKDSLSVGRGGSSAWVDVQLITTSKVSREHLRVRRDAGGRFFIQDVSLWGTSVDGVPLPPAVKGDEGVAQPGPEQELPPKARIDLAEAVTIQFEAATR